MKTEVEDNVKLSLSKAAEDDKNSILMELKKFKTMCKDSEETISPLVSTNKTQSNALEFTQFELVAYVEQQDKTSSIVETDVYQQEDAIRSLQNHVATVQSIEIEGIQSDLDVQREFSQLEEVVPYIEEQDKTNTQIKEKEATQQEEEILSIQNHVETLQSIEIEGIEIEGIQSYIDEHTQTNESESHEMASVPEITEKSEVQLSELKAAYQNDIQTERDRAIDFENKIHELNLSNTAMAQMNERSLIDCQKNLTELTSETKKVEESLRIKNEVTYLLLRDIDLLLNIYFEFVMSYNDQS